MYANSFYDKNEQDLVVTARLKKISIGVINMAADLRAEESRNFTDGHIVSVTSSDEWRLTTPKEGIWEKFSL